MLFKDEALQMWRTSKLCTVLINPFHNKLTFTVGVETNADRMEKKREGEIAPAFKMLIIQMRQSVPA